MADVNDIVGSSGDDTLNAAPGANNIIGGPGNDTISATDGVNTIQYQAGDGVDSIKFALPRTYQYARFLTEAKKGLADFQAFITTANTGLINALPFDISSILSDMRRGIATPAMADAARNQLIDWIGAPVGNVIQFGPGIKLSDIAIQVGATASFGAQQSTPVQFAVALNSEEGMVFGLDGPQVVARDLGAAALPPTIDMTFQFADGTTASLADLLAGPGVGAIGDQMGSEGNDFLHGTLGDDTLMGNGGDDKLDGGAGTDRLFGGDGDDVISGGSGDDAVFGEGGNDVLASGKNGGVASYMSGGLGDDVYCFNRGDGLVTIDDLDWTESGVDTLSFGNGVALSDLIASVDPASGNLMLGIAGTNDLVTIPWFDGTTTARKDSAIERVQFFDADGTSHAYDLGSLVSAAFPDPATADPTVSVVLVDPGSTKLSLSEAGQPYARSYALTGNLFPPENTAPTAGQAIDHQSATQDADFVFKVPANAFVDIDNDTLSYSAKLKDGSDLPSWLQLNSATGEFSGTPSNADVVDMLNIEVTASDGSASASQEFSLSVANVNDAPTAGQAIDHQSATQGADFVFKVPASAFVDIDNDTLSYSAKLKDGSDLPSWLQLNSATGEFSGTPSNADVVDMLNIEVTASDASASATQDFSLSVANVNDAPTVGTAIVAQSATQGVDFSFTVPNGAFVDIDQGDTLTYSAKLKDGSALPSWLTLDSKTGTFSGKPSNADVVDMLSIEVTASDGSASASQAFSLSVANVNDAPTVTNPIADQTATQGVAFAYTVPGNAFTDMDKGDVLTYTAKLDNGVALPSWLHFDGSTFAGTPGSAGTWNIHLVATDQSGTSIADEFKLTAAPAPVGSPPADPPPLSGRTINGTRGNDRLQGTPRDDMISGGKGRDSLWGAGGNDVLRGGSGDDRLDGGAGRDYLEGESGNDKLKGGSGVDLLQGGSGNDQLTDTSGNGLLDGGSGNDTLTEGSGNSMLVGGKGNDHLHLGGGYDIIAFNRGDGRDVVSSGKGGNATLSLGGGIRYQDLSLRRSGNDLILETGNNERITFEKWYAGKRYQAVSRLQVYPEAMPVDSSGASAMLDDKVESFDFKGLVGAFDSARRHQPGLSRWTLTNALAQFQLGDGSDSKALGGDLAYQYGVNSTLAGIAVNAAQGTAASTQFGKEAQTLHSQSELKDGLVKLS